MRRRSVFVTSSRAGAATRMGLRRGQPGLVLACLLTVSAVWGAPRAPAAAAANVAQGKPARQSSVGWGGAASRAVDGNTSGNWHHNSVTHTQRQRGSWWEVDLGRTYRISKIAIYNRTDNSGAGEPARLSNFEVVLSENGVNFRRVYYQAGAARPLTAFSLGALPSARYVRVRLLGTNYLSLAEVQVFAAPSGSAGARPLGRRWAPARAVPRQPMRSVPRARAAASPTRPSQPAGSPEEPPATAAPEMASQPALKPGVAEKAAGFLALLQVIKDLAGGIKQAAQGAAKGMDGLQGTLGTLVSFALDKFLLRGVRNPGLRKVIADGIGAMADVISKPGITLTKAVIAVLQKIRSPLSSLVSGAIQDASLRGMVHKGMDTVLRILASDAGVRKVMKNPLGFLTDLGLQLLERISGDLAGLILGKIRNPGLRALVTKAIETLANTVKREGFAVLLDFKKLLGKLYTALKGPVLALLLGQVQNPRLRAVLEDGINFVLSKLEADGISGLLQGGVGGFLVGLFERVQDPLIDLLLGSVGNPALREAAKRAVALVVSKAKTGGIAALLDVKKVIVEVVKALGPSLGEVVASGIVDPGLKGIVQKGLTSLLSAVATDAGASGILANPLGFLSEIGVKLIGKVKDGLAGLILGKIQNPGLQTVVAVAIGTLADTVKREGFAALLDFKKLLGKLYAALKQPLLDLLLDKVPHPRLRAVLEGGLTFVAAELETRGLSSVLQGGIGSFLVALVERIKSPLTDLLLENVASPLLRDGAKRAIDDVLAKAKSGRLTDLLNFKKAIAGIVRFLRPAIVGFLSGKVGDSTFARAMTAAVGPVVERVAGMIERGSFKGLLDIIGEVAEPALRALKNEITGTLPGTFKVMVGQAFDQVIPILKTADGRARLLREGPQMLWSKVVSYLRSLYEKAATFVADKVAQVREAIFRVLERIRSVAGNIGETLKGLISLGGLLGNTTLPGPT